LVLTEYEKEANKIKEGASHTKNFKFPPVLPVVFYDGPDHWAAETNFLNKTELSEVFGKYVPNFEYELVALNQYSKADLVRFGDVLSLIMLVDKIRKPEEISLLSQLPQDYADQLALNIPEHLKKIIADVITVLLSRIKAPKAEIDRVTEKIYKRGIQEMFELLEQYDVQETRRLEREKTQKEMREEMQKIMQAKEREMQAKERESVRRLRQKNLSNEEIADVLGVSIETVRDTI
jgi:DNA-binding CsgD family transcriptional regulator